MLAANKIAHNIKKTALVSKANNLHTTTNEEGKGRAINSHPGAEFDADAARLK